MNIRNKELKINELLNDETRRPDIPKELCEIISDLSNETKIDVKRLFTETILRGLKPVLRKYKADM